MEISTENGKHGETSDSSNLIPVYLILFFPKT